MGWQRDLEVAEVRSEFKRGARMAGFVLHRLIGLSVTGEIWQASHERTERKVALRLFSLLGVPGGLDTLRNEADQSRHL